MTIFFPHYSLGLGTGKFDNDLEEKVDKILHQVSEMTAKLHKLTDAVRKFEQCKACKKRYYKAVDNADISFEDQLSNIELSPSPSVSISPKASASNSPVSSLTTLKPQKSLNQLQKPSNERESTILIGSPSRGVYVAKKNVDQISKSSPKRFALKLSELVFSREEAKLGSVEGKGDKLLKLDPNRIAAVRECTEMSFPANENLKRTEIKKSIDEKCRMVRNNRCFVWAGVNTSRD